MLIGILQPFFMFSYVTGRNSFLHPLEPDEERDYVKKAMNGDDYAKDKLIEHNLRLVAFIAQKYNNIFREIEDLISIGTIGLIKAVGSYKLDKGTKLSTYAAKCIENEILMHFRSTKKLKNETSLQEPLGVDNEGNEVTYIEILPDKGKTVDEEVDLSIKSTALYKAIEEELGEREREIIKLRYGLKTGEEVTQRVIAKKLNISRSYVSRIEKKALGKLCKILKD